jgi:hypothetical protein
VSLLVGVETLPDFSSAYSVEKFPDFSPASSVASCCC